MEKSNGYRLSEDKINSEKKTATTEPTEKPKRRKAKLKSQDTKTEKVKVTIEEPEGLPDIDFSELDNEILKDIKNTSLVLVLVINGLVESFFGDECKITDIEQSLITQPLERIMEKYDIGNNKILQTYIDPIMLLLGISAWGSRIYRIQISKPKEEKEKEKEKPKSNQDNINIPVINNDQELGELLNPKIDGLRSERINP